MLLDVTSKDTLELPSVKTIVFAVGFDRSTSQSIHDVYVGGVQKVLQHLPSSVERFIYLSSTGVYGHTDGSWVDEDSPCHPFRDGGKACLAAEEVVRNHPSTAQRHVILRLAGIYGPERLPQAKTLQSGNAIPVAAEGHLNLIHVEDIARIIASCEQLPATGATFCVSDGSPVIRRDFYRYLAELLQCPPPEFQPPPPDSSQAARARGSKRISNKRLVEVLAPTWLYPSYKRGAASHCGVRRQTKRHMTDLVEEPLVDVIRDLARIVRS